MVAPMRMACTIRYARYNICPVTNPATTTFTNTAVMTVTTNIAGTITERKVKATMRKIERMVRSVTTFISWSNPPRISAYITDSPT